MRRRGGVSAFFMVAEGSAKVFLLQGFTGRLTFCTLRGWPTWATLIEHGVKRYSVL